MLKKILIVDENQYIRDILKNRFLNTTDIDFLYDVYDAEDGEKAYDIIKTENINVIITDINLPKISGFELVRQIKTDNNTRHIPIIFLTQNFHKEIRTKAYEYGVVGIIQKPFSTNEVYYFVKTILKMQEEYISLKEINDILSFLKNIMLVSEQNVIEESYNFMKKYFNNFRMLGIKRYNKEFNVVINNNFPKSEEINIIENIAEYKFDNLKQYIIIDAGEKNLEIYLILDKYNDNLKFSLLHEILHLWSELNGKDNK
ncbi:PleD family two-component system response regulator [Caldicellulosiruptoraceae bacterium PP1]